MTVRLFFCLFIYQNKEIATVFDIVYVDVVVIYPILLYATADLIDSLVIWFIMMWYSLIDLLFRPRLFILFHLLMLRIYWSLETLLKKVQSSCKVVQTRLNVSRFIICHVLVNRMRRQDNNKMWMSFYERLHAKKSNFSTCLNVFKSRLLLGHRTVSVSQYVGMG